MSVIEDILRHQRELQNQQLEFLQRQQEQFILLSQAIIGSRENPMVAECRQVQDRGARRIGSSRPVVLARNGFGRHNSNSFYPVHGEVLTRGPRETWYSGSPQIPKFGGEKSKNMATDGTTLLAASSKLVRTVRC